MYAEPWVNLRLENILSSSFPFLGWLRCPTILLLNLLAGSLFFFFFIAIFLYSSPLSERFSVVVLLAFCWNIFLSLLILLSLTLCAWLATSRPLWFALKEHFTSCSRSGAVEETVSMTWRNLTGQRSCFWMKTATPFYMRNFSLLPNSLPHLTFLHFTSNFISHSSFFTSLACFPSFFHSYLKLSLKGFSLNPLLLYPLRFWFFYSSISSLPYHVLCLYISIFSCCIY